MQLVGRNDNALTLSVNGYQFPNAVDDWDANWLVIRVDVRNDEGSWSATHPCLTTRELAELADWLERPNGELRFTEPNLELEVVGREGDDVELKVWFELELRPDWAESWVAGERDLSAALTVSRQELVQAAAELRGELAAFPPRGGWT